MLAPGVKGRPQACVTCHRRKKGCDLQRPSCGQCRKACIPCGGYTRTAAPSKTASRSKATPARDSSDDRSSEDVPKASVDIARTSSDGGSGYSYRGPPTPQPPASTAGQADHLYMSPAPSHYDGHYCTSGAFETWQDSPVAPSSATGTPAPASLPTPATTPTPMISYPDLSGSLTIQPKYPVHFADSASEDDSYAIYSPTTSFAYFASDQPSSSAPLDDDSSHDHNSNNSDSIQLDRRRRRNFLLRHQHQQRSADLHLSFAVSSSAHHERIIGLFWEVFLPNSRPLPTKTLGITLGGAVGAIGSYDLKGDALKKGLLAMAMTTVGKKQLQRLDGGPGSKDAERLRMEGIRLYGKALQQMSQTLKKGSKWTTEHWVTTRLFNLYEALYGADLQDHLAHRASWKVHSEGDIAFITSKPPSAYISDPAHTLFTAGRHHLLLFALFYRKRCILAEPVWKTVPWTVHVKNSRDRLIDILIDLPAVYEAIDTIKSWPDDSDNDRGAKKGRKEKARLMVRRGLTSVIDRLQVWNTDHALRTTPATLAHPPPVAATPEQYLAGHVMTLFWATCIRIYNNERLIVRADLHESTDPRIDPDECCASIVNAIRVFVQPAAGICRQHFTVYPMSTALQHLVDVGPKRMLKERESLWADLNKPHCILIKRFVMSIEPPKYRNEEEAKLGP